MKYPDTDHYCRDAVAHWQATGEPMETSVRFPRPWRREPDHADLPVRYRCEGDTAAPALIASIEGVEVSLDDPARLEPVVIDKPWGREIWYSGIEARGESRIVGRRPVRYDQPSPARELATSAH